MFKGETSRLEESVRLSFGMGSSKEDIDAFIGRTALRESFV